MRVLYKQATGFERAKYGPAAAEYEGGSEKLCSQITRPERDEYDSVAVRHSEGMRDCMVRLLGERDVSLTLLL